MCMYMYMYITNDYGLVALAAFFGVGEFFWKEKGRIRTRDGGRLRFVLLSFYCSVFVSFDVVKQ